MQVDGERVRFCSYCGSVYNGGERHARVCRGCGLGVMLTAARAALRHPGEPFVIVNASGRVSAASSTVDPLLGRADSLVGAPIATLLRATEPGEPLADVVDRAALGSATIRELTVESVISERPLARFHARVAACGEPPAALVVLHPLE